MGRKRFENLDQVSNVKKMADIRRWMKERRHKTKDLTKQISIQDTILYDFIQANKTEQAITWIGHSTFLVQMCGWNVLTDPVWAERMGVQKRLTVPGLAIHQLPEIDAVVISHGHYDHLDFRTLRSLPGDPIFLVPVGLARLLHRKGFRNVVELNWWESHEAGNITFTFVPAQHWTRRSLWDTNSSHWGGWVLQDRAGQQESVYFVGDTGYFRGFQLISEKFTLDTVLMPIGAYEPEWFMKQSHINPEDAVRAFAELRGKRLVPMHYGAYRLADDTGPEALARLYDAWEHYDGIGELCVLKIGGTLRIGEPHKTKR